MSRHLHGAWVAAVAIALATGLRVDSLAQAPPDFTGTWVVEQVEGSVGAGGPGGPGGAPQGRGRAGGPGWGGRRGGFGGPGGAGGGGGRGGSRPEGGGDGARRGPASGGAMYRVGDVVTVRQSPDRVIVTRETEGGAVMMSYALDGSESTNPGMAGGASTSKSKWEGVALVTEMSSSVDGPRGKMTMKSREVRTLGEGRNAMTLTVALDTPRGKQLTTVTFGRREAVP